MLKEIIETRFYEPDYNNITKKLLYEDVSYDEAVKRNLQVERRRASYYNYYTGKQWGYAASYDFCIDSSAIGSAETARLIAEFVRKKLKL
jgi:chloramphenicol 3-O-phosphotransferase